MGRQFIIILHLLFRLVLLQPSLNVWSSSNINIVDEEHTSTGHSGWSSMLKVGNFKNKSHLGGERDTLLGHKGKHLVVIHDGVKGLNPSWLDISIEDNPLVLVTGLESVLGLVHVSHNDREKSILPLLGLWIHVSIKLIRGYGLGIKALIDGFLTENSVSFAHGLPNFGLSSTW